MLPHFAHDFKEEEGGEEAQNEQRALNCEEEERSLRRHVERNAIHASTRVIHCERVTLQQEVNSIVQPKMQLSWILSCIYVVLKSRLDYQWAIQLKTRLHFRLYKKIQKSEV